MSDKDNIYYQLNNNKNKTLIRLTMNRLIKAIALLPLLLLLSKSGMELSQGKIVTTSYWVFGLAGLNVFALNMALAKLREGIKGVLYSGLMANFLLVLSVLFGQTVSILTLLIFFVYAIGVYSLALLDLINVKYVDRSKAETPFHSSGNGLISGSERALNKREGKRRLDELQDEG